MYSCFFTRKYSVQRYLSSSAGVMNYAAATLFFISTVSPSVAADAYEAALNLKASDFLQQKFLQSTLYSVEEKIENDGFVNRYTVKSGVGTFHVNSNIALYKLLGELEAIDAMKRVEESDAFLTSLKESGVNTVEGLKKLFTAPGTTLENAASGLRSLFSRAEESVFNSSPGKTEDSRFEQTIGFSKAKRDVAHRYKVDVYSENKVLQQHLERIAWAEYAGGLTLGVATMPVGGVAGATLSVSGTARLLGDVIATTPPAELKLQNREKLGKMGIDADLADLFIENPHFSPLQQTAAVLSLEKTEAAANRSLPLQTALQVNDQDMARFMSAIMAMFAGYNKQVAPIDRFVRVARVFGAMDKNGKLIIILPADYMTWTERLAASIDSLASSNKDQSELWILGTASEKAKSQLQAVGWKVKENIAEKIGFQM